MKAIGRAYIGPCLAEPAYAAAQDRWDEVYEHRALDWVAMVALAQTACRLVASIAALLQVPGRACCYEKQHTRQSF